MRELNNTEMMAVNGGGLGDVFEKLNPLELGKAVYKAGQDFGAAGVKFGRELYDFYKDVKTILK